MPFTQRFTLKFAVALAVCSLSLFSAAAQSKVGWSLVWSDEFNQPDGSSPDSAKWVFDLGAGGWGNNELQHYTSRTNNARIENGQLVIEAKQENYQGSTYTSARLKTLGKAWWTYGRIEARIKIPRTQGIWPAFWTLGTNIASVGWPTCGEIDIMENIGAEPRDVHGTVHGPGYSGGAGIGGTFTLPGAGAYADDFHVFAVEWTTNQIKWFMDGLQYFSITPARLPGGTNWVFTQPQFLLMNVAVGGNWPGYPDGTTVLPQRMLVDYVRVYAPTNMPARTNALKNAGFETGGLTNWIAYGAGFNTLAENINAVPVHDGSGVFKVFGQFNNGLNYSGVWQDSAVTPGQTYDARGWALTPAGDAIAGANKAWLEVSFRDAATNILSLHRSANITSNSLAGGWLELRVTNQLNPATFVVIGSVTNLLAPTNAAFARVQVVFEQPGNAAGAVLFDDLQLTPASALAWPTPVSVGLNEGYLNLAFATLLGLSYQIRSKPNLVDAAWLELTNVTGSGATFAVPFALQGSTRFYQVVRCE